MHIHPQDITRMRSPHPTRVLSKCLDGNNKLHIAHLELGQLDCLRSVFRYDKTRTLHVRVNQDYLGTYQPDHVHPRITSQSDTCGGGCAPLSRNVHAIPYQRVLGYITSALCGPGAILFKRLVSAVWADPQSPVRRADEPCQSCQYGADGVAFRWRSSSQ